MQIQVLIDAIERAGTPDGAAINKCGDESDTRTKCLHIAFPLNGSIIGSCLGPHTD